MDDIVCNINNAEPDNYCSKAAFTVVEALMSHPLSGVHPFIKAVDKFTEDDFIRLNHKVQNEVNTKIYLTERDLIVYYSVVYFASIAVNSSAETQWLIPYYSGKESTFNILKAQVTDYAKSIAIQFNQNLSHLDEFMEIVKMIPVE
ncbi:MAG: hypothetical protein IPP77_01660 [Bacteroidetes bacterium]|nr:hypothetical protein [Bacteroidota bacterium]